MFENVFGFPGSDPGILLVGFVFLVALGIDYNIFLMTRAREEAAVHGTRDGVLRGAGGHRRGDHQRRARAGATFGALAVLPLVLLSELAFLVGFGVLLDTFVVRSLLVPAAVDLIGDKVWWPSRLVGRRGARWTTRCADDSRGCATDESSSGHDPSGSSPARPRPRRTPRRPATGGHGLVLPAVGPRVGAEEADVVADPVQRGQRLPHPRVGDVALAVEGEASRRRAARGWAATRCGSARSRGRRTR